MGSPDPWLEGPWFPVPGFGPRDTRADWQMTYQALVTGATSHGLSISTHVLLRSGDLGSWGLGTSSSSFFGKVRLGDTRFSTEFTLSDYLLNLLI